MTPATPALPERPLPTETAAAPTRVQAASRQAPPPWPPLRQELLLHRAPDSHDGAPLWTLEDPGRNLFFQLGAAQVQMLARWALGDAQRIADAVSEETLWRVSAAEVQALAQFLDQQSLLQLRGPAAIARLAKEAHAKGQHHWLQWLLHHYLFFRIPLVRPDAFLTRTLPWVAGVFFTRTFARATALAAVLGLFLVARQWNAFVHTFLHFFTLEGALVAALTLGCTKVLHELGHAYAAKYHGCRVATMGVAFMVMWPVLYTDTSGAWRLQSRRQRLQIGAAGMLTETALAAWATLAWSFLPDGILRSAAFMLATTTWLLTLAVNLNPLMRFDGYFLLSDALNVPNLQNRAFALARWQLREWLFGFQDPQPEVFAPWRQRSLLLYAYAVWVYRFFLFLGIALLVYHFAFKLLGIVLFAVEIIVFILRPLYRELTHWSARLFSGQNRLNRRSLLTGAALLMALLLMALPWHTRIHAPALAKPAVQQRLLAPVGAQVAHLAVQNGQTVPANAPLIQLRSPDLAHELQSLTRRIQTLEWQINFQGMRAQTLADVPIAQRELQAARQRLQTLTEQSAQLDMRAPFDAVVVDMAEPLQAGEWVGAGEWLATLAQPQTVAVQAYVTEADLHRIALGDVARFIAQDPSQSAWPLRITAIASTATTRLGQNPELVSALGGAIAAQRAPASARAAAAHEGPDWVPEQAIYQVTLTPETTSSGEPVALQHVLSGTVVLEGAAQSLLARALQRAAAVWVRESGF